jgi:hypothetical protein
VLPEQQEDGPSLCIELSKELLHKYVKKAKKSVQDIESGPYDDHKDDKAFKRKMYVAYAEKHRLKEEQIDELSKKTLTNYSIKASSSATSHDKKSEDEFAKADKADSAGNDWRAFHHEGQGIKHFDKAQKRRVGIKLAAKKIAKEETQIDELKTSTYHNYIRKARHIINNTPEDAKSHKKAKEGIARAERLLTKEETEELNERVLSTKKRKHLKKKTFGLPSERKYPMPDKRHAANAKARATQMEKKGKLSSSEATKIRAKANRILGEEKDEIIRHPEHKKAYVQKYKTATGEIGYKASNKHGHLKFFNEIGRKSAMRHAHLEESFIPFSEFIQLDERELRSTGYLATVHWRDTKKPAVRHHKGRKMKGFARLNKTQYVTHLLYRNRNQHDTQHLTSRSKHQLTDRWRDRRINLVKQLKKSKNIHGTKIHEDNNYLKNRQLLHDAHAQAGREIGKRERDPELKRIHLHRSRKHAHASKVLDILRNRKKK